MNQNMTAEQAIEEARTELSRCHYLSDCGANAGIRAMYSKKAEWLNILVWLAEQHLIARSAQKRSESE